MRILMFSPFYYPRIGGVERHVQRLSRELVDNGHSVVIITQKHDDTLPNCESLDNIEVYRMPSRGLLKRWLWLFEHRSLIKKSDLVHFHDFNAFYWYFPFRFVYFLKSTFITFHGFEGIIPIPKRIKMLRKMAEFLTRGNICIGDFITKWYGTNASFVSYGAVDDVRIEAKHHNGRAVFVGRLENDSGIETYLEALRIISENFNRKVGLDIFGDGSLRQELQTFVDRNELDVNLHGFVTNPEPYIANAKYAFVSGYLAILEAMIQRKFVFATYDNALKKDYLELIPNSKDMIVISGSAEELAERILHYDDRGEERQKLVDRSYVFATSCSWDKMAKRYLRLWNAF
jgi:glycosyltransferase involved in cell wall biosynthesis